MKRNSKSIKWIENILFSALLIGYPLIKANQGIDVSDTAYSLANFQFFHSMDGTWIIATFLSNVVGSLFTHLPFGTTLLGMNFYTALLQSLTAVVAYLVLRRRIPAPLVFLGEMIALGLCWCPSVILYNYLTYLLMTAGVLLLYCGILKENNRKYLLAAGVCLGVNVAVRMPNVVQAAFIIVVWYGAALRSRRWRGYAEDTFWCVCGYLLGFGYPFFVICGRYGVRAYPDMVRTMFAMTDNAVDYKPASMLTGMLQDYMRGAYWMLFAGICIAGGLLLFKVQSRLFAGSRAADWLCKIGYAMVLLVLLRFYWGKGMFSFRYYEYGAMYYPTVLLLLVTVFAACYCLIKKEVCPEKKILAALVAVLIFVTPLGSNNALYPIINNLFIAVPFVLWVAYDWMKAEKTAFVFKVPLVILGAFILIQSIGFHIGFVFQDGVWGERRDVTVEKPAKAAGIYTNRENGEALEELAAYVEATGLAGRKTIFFGEIPGLAYLLDMPSALSTFWPDLDSYRMEEYERDMEQVQMADIYKFEEYPLIIAASPAAGWLGGKSDQAPWQDIYGSEDNVSELLVQKWKILKDFAECYGYQETFSNERYTVYEVK